MDQNDITLLLALYGAILATIVGLREISRYKRKLSVQVRTLTQGDLLRLEIILTNVGQPPINITGMEIKARIMLGDSKKTRPGWMSLPFTSDGSSTDEIFPIRLEEGEHATLEGVAGDSEVVNLLLASHAIYQFFYADGKTHEFLAIPDGDTGSKILNSLVARWGPRSSPSYFRKPKPIPSSAIDLINSQDHPPVEPYVEGNLVRWRLRGSQKKR